MENIWTGFLKQQPEPHIEQASILWKGEEEEGRRERGREGGRKTPKGDSNVRQRR